MRQEPQRSLLPGRHRASRLVGLPPGQHCDQNRAQIEVGPENRTVRKRSTGERDALAPAAQSMEVGGVGADAYWRAKPWGRNKRAFTFAPALVGSVPHRISR